MTTEDDFQRMLDANPDDWQTRIIFADWLEEQGDPRAEGYRALGALRLTPGRSRMHQPKQYFGFSRLKNGSVIATHSRISDDWFCKIEGADLGNQWWHWFWRRRNLEDAAALAFAHLPAERRAELLAQPATA